MDRKLIAATILLLSIQLFLLLTGWPYDQNRLSSTNLESSTAIGVLVDKKQNVKRRARNSVVWEDSETADTILTYDNVMTLDNSSAEINLSGGIHVELHENTLVVVEPPSPTEPDLFRIRFSRGQMVGVTSANGFQVGTETWEISARRGADLSIQNLGSDKMELEVRSGDVDLKNNTSQKIQKVSKNYKYDLSKTEVTNSEPLSESMKFENQKEFRIYTHEKIAAFEARWSGTPSSILISQANSSSHEMPIEIQDSKSQTLALPLGTHFLRLKSADQKISPEITVEVMPAQRIRYTSPLPRDRFDFGTTALFSWLPLENATHYVYEITDSNGHIETAENTDTRFLKAPGCEGETQFRVFGVDAGGFKIPPQYSLPIYFVHNPLAPPKLNVPKARAPAGEKRNDKKSATKPAKTSWLDFIRQALLPRAFADDIQTRRQIILSWEPVTGADFYNLEISETADFADPEVLTKVSETTFFWSDYQKSVYYWRVAAGDSSGRMGIFSEVAKFDLSKIDFLQNGEIAPGVSVAPLATKKPKSPLAEKVTALVEKTPPAPAPQANSPQVDEAPAHKFARKASIEANLHYRTSSVDGTDFTANLDGFANISASAWLQTERDDGQLYLTEFRYAQVKWAPADKKAMPFQPNWINSEWALRMWRESRESDWGFGLLVETVERVERTANEKIGSSTRWQVGPAFSYHVNISEELLFHTSDGVLAGGSIISIETANFINYTLEKNWHQPYIGGDLDLKLYFGSSSYSGFDLTSGFHVGIHF